MTAKATGIDENLLRHLREQTPGLANRVHLDNCGSALQPLAVVEAMKDAFELEIAVGGYVAQEQQAPALEAAYGALARLFGGKVKDYAFVGSAVDG